MTENTETQTEIENRFVGNYNAIPFGGQVILMKFAHDLVNRRLVKQWRVWVSEYDFNFGAKDNHCIGELSKDFILQGTEYDAFQNTFGQIVSATDARVAEIFGIDSFKHELTNYEIDGFSRVMQFNALPKGGELLVLDNKFSDVADGFNLKIQANKKFLSSVGGACLQYAAGRDTRGFYALLMRNIQRQMARGE